MVKKIFITAFSFFCIYTIYVSYLAPQGWFASQHQWQDNFIKAQTFLYDDSTQYNNVIVGSSVSSRIITKDLPNTYSLSFSGQGIFDGLNILSHKKIMPKNIFIEINYIFRKENTQFTNSLLSPVLFYPRKTIPSLREEKEPIAILGKFPISIWSKFYSAKHTSKINSHSNNNSINQGLISESLFLKMLKNHIAEYTEIPNREEVISQFDKLKYYTTYFSNKGVNIIFFEMPVNYLLEELPRAKCVRTEFITHYPFQKYQYFLIPDTLKYNTVDGIHLGNDEATNYTMLFKDRFANSFNK